jgi:uncharacterized membrane protein HdeD (DUF308 family)
VETLGLSDSSTPRSEGRLKSLFWPSIESGSDVDYLGAQGYWVCTLVAVLSFVLLIVAGQPITGAAILLFYYLGGIGVRERSRYAAVVVFLMYLLDTLLSPGVIRVLLAALLLSNLRATWIASGWKPGSEQSILPPRLNETWADKFADTFPAWIWPKIQILYFVFSAGFLLLVIFGLVMLMLGKFTHELTRLKACAFGSSTFASVAQGRLSLVKALGVRDNATGCFFELSHYPPPRPSGISTPSALDSLRPLRRPFMAQQTTSDVVRQASSWSLLWGVLLIVLGVMAVGSPMIAAVAVNVVVAWLVVLAGVAHLALAFHARGAGSVIWRTLVGLAYVAFGVYLVAHPVIGVASLTLVLGSLFLVEGILDIALFFQLRAIARSRLFLLDGIVTLLLGLMIYLQWPSSSAWAIGTLVGVSLIISGVTRVMMSLAVRKATDIISPKMAA